MFSRLQKNVDWVIFFSIIPLVIAGLFTMNSFTADNYFFHRQLIWVAVSLSIFFVFSAIDWRFLRSSGVLVSLYLFAMGFLSAILLLGIRLKEQKVGFLSEYLQSSLRILLSSLLF